MKIRSACRVHQFTFISPSSGVEDWLLLDCCCSWWWCYCRGNRPSPLIQNELFVMFKVWIVFRKAVPRSAQKYILHKMFQSNLNTRDLKPIWSTHDVGIEQFNSLKWMNWSSLWWDLHQKTVVLLLSGVVQTKRHDYWSVYTILEIHPHCISHACTPAYELSNGSVCMASTALTSDLYISMHDNKQKEV